MVGLLAFLMAATYTITQCRYRHCAFDQVRTNARLPAVDVGNFITCMYVYAHTLPHVTPLPRNTGAVRDCPPLFPGEQYLQMRSAKCHLC